MTKERAQAILDATPFGGDTSSFMSHDEWLAVKAIWDAEPWKSRGWSSFNDVLRAIARGDQSP